MATSLSSTSGDWQRRCVRSHGESMLHRSNDAALVVVAGLTLGCRAPRRRSSSDYPEQRVVVQVPSPRPWWTSWTAARTRTGARGERRLPLVGLRSHERRRELRARRAPARLLDKTRFFRYIHLVGAVRPFSCSEENRDGLVSNGGRTSSRRNKEKTRERNTTGKKGETTYR
jgi:hypothetical protein